MNAPSHLVRPSSFLLAPSTHVRAVGRAAAPLGVALALTAAAAAQDIALTVQGTVAPAGAGGAVVFLPDVDGDGVRDFAVGSPLEAPAGAVRVHSGRDASVLRTLVGVTPGAAFGHALALVHDLDGGGLADLMIGAPGTSFSHQGQGTAYVYTLEAGTRWIQVFGSGTNSRMGYAVADIGDIDGDGVHDLAAGEPGADSSGLTDNGAVVTLSGATLQFLTTVRGNESGEQLGFALAAWADIDGDGADEWLAGAPFHSAAGQQGGRVVVVHGGDHAPWWSFFGGYQGEHFGMALLGLGDTDGDGVGECVIGAPDHSSGALNRGRVAWFEGLAAQPHEERVGVSGERLGRSLAAVDFNGDGVREVAAGAPNHVSGTPGRVGAVRFFDASTSVPGATLVGFAVDGEFGVALAGGADLNGDGAEELAIGARAELVHRGVVRVLLGASPASTVYCTAKVTSLGCTPRIGASGGASLSVGAGLRVFAHGVTPNAAGLLFYGLAPTSHPLHGGTLCVTQSLRRTAVQFSSVGASGCSSSFSYDFTPAVLMQAGLAAGTHVYAQYWWRDGGFPAPGNIGLSDAVEFVVVP
jgi:hypothetical protein